jgi:branched-chain amino acid aminotransferase
MTAEFVALDGQIISYDHAHIAPFDAGFLHGVGLFETMRAVNGRVFRLSDHLRRLASSAAALELPISLDEKAIEELIAELLEANDLKHARVRLTVTRGDMAQADKENPDPPRSVLISAAPLTGYPEALYIKGMTVMVSGWSQNPHNPLCGHKTTSYFDRLLALRQTQAAQAGEALWFTEKEKALAEGCISNVFVVDNVGTLLTPPWQMPGAEGLRLALPGITRQTVLELAVKYGIAAQERVLYIHDLLEAKEVFLTNAIMGIMPVSRIERQAVGDEKPGALSKRLRELYEKEISGQVHGR